jgi:hypothetical protein
MSAAKTTTDHVSIRDWAEARDGHPAIVKTDGPGGILRIDFGEQEEGLEKISWPEFFRIFDENGLAFLYQDDKGKSRFNKFVRQGEEK